MQWDRLAKPAEAQIEALREIAEQLEAIKLILQSVTGKTTRAVLKVHQVG